MSCDHRDDLQVLVLKSQMLSLTGRGGSRIYDDDSAAVNRLEASLRGRDAPGKLDAVLVFKHGHHQIGERSSQLVGRFVFVAVESV